MLACLPWGLPWWHRRLFSVFWPSRESAPALPAWHSQGAWMGLHCVFVGNVDERIRAAASPSASKRMSLWTRQRGSTSPSQGLLSCPQALAVGVGEARWESCEGWACRPVPDRCPPQHSLGRAELGLRVRCLGSISGPGPSPRPGVTGATVTNPESPWSLTYPEVTALLMNPAAAVERQVEGAPPLSQSCDQAHISWGPPPHLVAPKEEPGSTESTCELPGETLLPGS